MQSFDRVAAIEGVKHLLNDCAGIRPTDKVLLVYDDLTFVPAEFVKQTASELGFGIELTKSPIAQMHGQEPSPEVATKMRGASLVLGMTSKSMAHTQARISACQSGARYLSLPEYSLNLLADPSLTADFRTIAKDVRRLSDCFTAGSFVQVRTPSGTDIKLKIDGRLGNYCPGFVDNQGELGSPPDIEANISPVETASEGIAVIDGSIPYPGLGLLKSPVTLVIERGRIQEMTSDDAHVLSLLQSLFASTDPRKTKVLAEFGVGFNPKAKLQGIMLTDEGVAGTAHFGFGSNSTVGGLNKVSFHLDFVFKNPEISVDHQVVFKDKRLCL